VVIGENFVHHRSMTDRWQPPASGALDDTAWPETLVAKAVEPGVEDDRLHGYSVLGDLACHFEFSEVLYLAITGELPDASAAARFRIAMIALASMGVHEAPTHIALLSRICGGAIASALGAGLVATADQARFKVEAQSDLLKWLHSPVSTPPETSCSKTADDAAWVRTLCSVIPDSELVRPELGRDAACIALLFEAGIRTPEQFETAFVASRFCGLAAEALSASPADLGSYPVKLPPFHYVEDKADR
jgi:hypothetical protein